MAYAIAAAGTGGHVFPGLAVGEALVEAGVERGQVIFVGGNRLEREVYPAAGFPFIQLELRGLKRSMSPSNLGIARVMKQAARQLAEALTDRGVAVVLGMGGYVTVPAGTAASRIGATLFLHEQNAEAGLANRLMKWRANEVFTSFPGTRHLPRGRWTGNPIRSSLARFDRSSLRPSARERYGLDPEIPVVGVVGGSLGSDAINRAVEGMIEEKPDFQVLHLAGKAHAERLRTGREPGGGWVVLGFETDMEFFYAASDLVVARAGGAVAELTATATPSILIPGGFGSGGHQHANAAALAEVGAATIVNEREIARLPIEVRRLLGDRHAMSTMVEATSALARPDAARDIASTMVGVHG